jgi:hypothetical protein
MKSVERTRENQQGIDSEITFLEKELQFKFVSRVNRETITM